MSAEVVGSGLSCGAARKDVYLQVMAGATEQPAGKAQSVTAKQDTNHWLTDPGIRCSSSK